MPGLLTTSSVLMCPHGGSITATPTNTRSKAGGSALVCATDTFMVAGCTFNISGAPHPCMQVQWISPGLKGTASSSATLTEASVGLCVAADGAPQGGVLINSTQPESAGL
jgi:hypothetical protein